MSLFRSSRIRWRIFAFLVAFAMLGFFQQKSVSVAAERIMPELSLSQMQIGWIQWAFLLGYMPCQLLGGVFGQRFGARRTFIIIGLIAFAAAVSMPLAPSVLAGTALFVGLLLAQFALGIAQAPIYPVSAGVLEAWFPAKRWAFVNGLQSMGQQLGAAITPPIIVYFMQTFGWREALFWTSVPALALVALWAWYGRDTPREHPSVTADELAELDDQVNTGAHTGVTLPRILRLLGNRDILLLSGSYVCMNYVFYLLSSWSFLYLVQERHFTVLESGLLAAMPPLGAALGAGIGGGLADSLCMRFGIRWGYRLLPLVALPTAGLLLLCAVYAANAYVAVAALTLSYASVELNEGTYWAATMQIARADTMTATGILNTGGSLGGLFGIPIVAYLSGHHAWNAAFMLGTLFAMAAAAAWFGIDTSRRGKDA